VTTIHKYHPFLVVGVDTQSIHYLYKKHAVGSHQRAYDESPVIVKQKSNITTNTNQQDEPKEPIRREL